MKSISVEYDFKTTKIKLVKNGKLKNKYICLPYMITLPLSQPINPISNPIQPDPTYKITIINAIDTTNGWLNLTPVQNIQPNIISIIDNTLLFNKYSYNYRITANVTSKGDTSTPLRFMAQNPYSLLASNMNDVYGNETSYNTETGQQIQFTVTGEYQFFYIYYDTTNFNINITINIDYNTYPSLICKSKCKKSTCYTDKNNGYLKVKDNYIPVYTKKIIGTTITQYLYPEFGYLRDLFYNVTLNNSLPLPVISNSNINNLTTTVINCGVSSDLWCNYTLISGDLVTLYGNENQLPNQMYQNHNAVFKYSWPETAGLLTMTNNRTADFIFYYYWGGAWYIGKRITEIDKSGTLRAGSYINNSGYQWIAFGIDQNAIVPDDIRRQPTGTTFQLTITEE